MDVFSDVMCNADVFSLRVILSHAMPSTWHIAKCIVSDVIAQKFDLGGIFDDRCVKIRVLSFCTVSAKLLENPFFLVSVFFY